MPCWVLFTGATSIPRCFSASSPPSSPFCYGTLKLLSTAKSNFAKKNTHFYLRYSLFIIAFGLGFFILLHSDEAKTMKKEKDEEEKTKFFDHLGLSIVKTFSMFVGELEFSEVPFQVSPRFFGAF